ncbi:hypothetical protein AB0G79_33105 [Streptomyces sp. NPDC020807]|uniref:hypothetical protein n=1 Tax=Streptomyces sp. NPDC020807 TaxID=3155119 RepID=UPI0033F853C1
MTDTRFPASSRGTLIPLMVDATTGHVRNLDLEVTPHLLVVGRTGYGATSALRLLAAQAAKGGMDVRVITAKPREWNSLTGLPGLAVHNARDETGAPFAIEEFTYGMTSHLEDFLFEGQKANALLVADGLAELRGVLLGGGAERRPALDALAEVALLGRAAGYHLAASIRADQAGQIPRAFVDCSAVLTLGPIGNRVRGALLGAAPGPSGAPAGLGGGEFADYDGPRPVRTLWLDEARLWWPED